MLWLFMLFFLVEWRAFAHFATSMFEMTLIRVKLSVAELLKASGRGVQPSAIINHPYTLTLHQNFGKYPFLFFLYLPL
jgi:hypothetical protein